MAQTKRKRRSTKHRGDAAGRVASRGRTGRKPTKGESGKNDKKLTSQQKREARLDKPPTWKGAIQRAGIAVVIFVVAILLLFNQDPIRALPLAGVMLLIYIPLSYYTDLFFYRRRQAKKRQAKGGKKPTKG